MKAILLNFPVPIITPRLMIRPPQMGDGVLLNEAIIESQDILSQFMPWAKDKPSVDESEEFVRQAQANWILKKNEEPYLPLFLFDKNSNKFIGASGYHHYDWSVPCIEIGYWIRKSSSGQGLMTEAVNALTQYAFRYLGVKRIGITCDVENIRSKKIPERLGFALESIIKSNRLNVSGQVTDTLSFARFGLDDLPELEVLW